MIEAAINTVASEIGSAFANPATVRFNVSWGSVGGVVIPSGDISSSTENLSGPYSFATITSDLRSAALANPTDAILQSAVAHFPKSSPVGALNFDVPYAEAQALGLLPPKIGLAAGGVGFSTAVNWDFNPLDGVASNAYDFEGAATHEIMEVLGRISGLQSSKPTLATPLDLFRYSASGVSSFAYGTQAYFSIDGGVTAIEHFNITGSGDRSDITAAAGLTDVQAAFLPQGVALTLSAADLSVLDALGWGAYTPPQLAGGTDPLYAGTVQSFGGAVPEPAAWSLMLVGFMSVGAACRSKSRANKVVAGSLKGPPATTRLT